MTQEIIAEWCPGVAYGVGAKVRHSGKTFRVIQAHTAQGDWAPENVPALFTVEAPGYGGDAYGQKENWSGYPKPEQPPSAPAYAQQQPYEIKPQTEMPKPESGYAQPTPSYEQQEQPEEPKEESFFQSNAFKIGAGILGGALALGAVGATAYGVSQHLKKKNAYNEWESEAKDATMKYAASTTKPAAYWVLTHGDSIPPNAIEAGREASGNCYYLARWWHEGGVLIGKADPIVTRGAAVGFRGSECYSQSYEILVGDASKVTFVEAVNGELPTGVKPVEGGHLSDGEEIYCAQASHGGHLIPGYAGRSTYGAVVGFGGKAVTVPTYKVLCYQ